MCLYFCSPDVFVFLRQLKRNNDREWFAKNKARYQTSIVEPALSFIGGLAPQLEKTSPFFVVIGLSRKFVDEHFESCRPVTPGINTGSRTRTRPITLTFSSADRRKWAGRNSGRTSGTTVKNFFGRGYRRPMKRSAAAHGRRPVQESRHSPGMPHQVPRESAAAPADRARAFPWTSTRTAGTPPRLAPPSLPLLAASRARLPVDPPCRRDGPASYRTDARSLLFSALPRSFHPNLTPAQPRRCSVDSS